MKMTRTTFVFLVGIACVLATSKDAGWRIIGETANDGQFPYQVSLKFAGSHSCGGSIIDETTILCAAHCVQGRDPGRMTVLAGTIKLNEGGAVYQVKKIIVHPDYNANKIVHDISIIKLADPIQFSKKVAKIALSETATGGNVDCVLSGWGSSVLKGGSPNDLHWINMQTNDIESCKKAHSSDGMIVYDSEICTLTKRGEGACHGDSGGPLVSSRNNKQIGIVSWGRPCAKDKPDVFTRVESYIDWINANK